MPLPQFKAGMGQTVTFINRQVVSQDAYGNDVYDEVEVDVPGCAVSPTTTTETWQGTDQIEADITVHAPNDTVVNTPLDRMRIDGVEYNVFGDPRAWVSPFTGTTSFLEVLGKLITTGGAAT